MNIPRLSIVCPVLNESAYIDNLCKFLSESEPADKEIFLIDGGSKDDTIVRINKWIDKGLNIILLQNPLKYVPYALNIAIPKTTGEIIVRLDAHNTYSNDYFIKIIETFTEIGADIVGGPVRTAFKTNFQGLVAEAVKSKFGTGNSNLYDYEYRGYTDHVILGAWRKEIFEEVGYFDEEMLRDQDEEFHYRAVAKGKKIYINPDIKLFYYPRDTLKKLARQYFQYGLFKPLALNKAGHGLKVRHLAPSLFAIYLIVSLFAMKFFLFIPAILYILVSLYMSFRIAEGKKFSAAGFLIFPAMHLSYGIGFLSGLFLGRQVSKMLLPRQG